MKIYIALLAVIVIMYGCESTDSESIKNSGLYANITITETGSDSAQVLVDLNVGGNNGTNVNLSSDERFDVTANGEVKTLQKNDKLDDILEIIYEANIAVQADETLFKVDFFRADEPNVLNSNVVLPTGFLITKPVSNDSFSTMGTSTIEWSPVNNNGSMEIIITTVCKLTSGGETTNDMVFNTVDDGAFEVNFGSQIIDKIASVDRNQNCTVSILATRKATGNLATGYGEGGSIVANRQRSISNVTLMIDN